MKNQKQFLPKLSDWFPKILILLTVLILVWLARPYWGHVIDVIRDREAVTAQLETLGLWGPLLYLLVLSLQIITAIIPGHALMLSVGYLYGFSGGFALNLIGAVGASQLAFLIARRTGLASANSPVPASILKRWQTAAERQGILFFLICFWFPIIPSNFANYLAGLGSISFWSFLIANFFGRLPGLILITLLGSHGVELTWQQWAVIAAVGLSVIVTGRYLTTKLEQSYGQSDQS